MIEFTDDQIKAAATAMKILRLAQHPGMDSVAIKLNSQPTYQEIEQAKMWAMAFSNATRSDLARPMDSATEIAKRFGL